MEDQVRKERTIGSVGSPIPHTLPEGGKKSDVRHTMTMTTVLNTAMSRAAPSATTTKSRLKCADESRGLELICTLRHNKGGETKWSGSGTSSLRQNALTYRHPRALEAQTGHSNMGQPTLHIEVAGGGGDHPHIRRDPASDQATIWLRCLLCSTASLLICLHVFGLGLCSSSV